MCTLSNIHSHAYHQKYVHSLNDGIERTRHFYSSPRSLCYYRL